MKKRLLGLLLVTSNLLWSQYYSLPVANGNPNNINQEDAEYPYTASDVLWTPIVTPSKPNPVWSALQNLPFTFVFSNDTVSSYKVSSSGVLTFDVSSSVSPPTDANTVLPSTLIPNQSICVWGLSGKGSNDNIITRVFGTSPNQQLWVTFSNYSEPNTFNTHWTHWSIVLEETTNHIYLVDQRNYSTTPTLTLGVQLNNLEASQITGSPNIAALASNDASRIDNKFYTFVKGNLPQYDVKALSIILDPYLFANQGPYDFKTAIENTGSETVQSLELQFQINNGPIQTSLINNLNIAPFSSDTLTNLSNWNPSANGLYNIKLWINSINGNADQNNFNDTLLFQTNVVGTQYTRMPLFEMMTSSTSIAAKNINQQLQNILNNNNAVVYLKYPMNWPGSGDPYNTTESNERRQYYNITNIDEGVLDGVWQKNASYLTQSEIDVRLEKPALVSLNTSYSVSNKTVNIISTVNPLESIAGNHKIYMAVVEKETFKNAKNNGETKFYHILKKMIPNATGIDINLQKGTALNINYNYTFKGNYRLPANANSAINHNTENSVEDFNNLMVVTWIQNVNTKEILQSQYAQNTISVLENQAKPMASIFPNPANQKLNIRYSQFGTTEVRVYNQAGQSVWNKTFEVTDHNPEIEIPIVHYSAGIYFVQIKIENNYSLEKILIE